MIKKIRHIIPLLFVVVLLAACSEYQKVLKSSDYELKYQKAQEYYEEQDYYKALNLYDELVNIYKGTKRAEKVYYYYAYCHYGQSELDLAAYHFKKFSKTYPNSEHQEEADYMAAYCLYLVSPEHSLDQTYTRKGLDELQLFLDRYPESEYRDSVNILIDELHGKLEQKAYDNAYLFYHIKDYKAAIKALENAIKDYPDSPYNEDAGFYILKSSYLLAENSVESKKQERYENTLKAYHSLMDRYPKTEYAKDAKRIYEKTDEIIN